MNLRPEHRGDFYGLPPLTVFERPPSQSRLLQQLAPVHHGPASDEPGLADSGSENLVRRFSELMELRAELAYRRLSGESLNAKELALLSALNRFAHSALPPIDRAPEEIREAAAEVRLLKRMRDAED